MTVRLVARPRGPLVLENPSGAPIEVVRADGRVIDLASSTKLRLCRCGASAGAPLCDGSHDRIGFEAPPCAGDREGD